MIRYKQKGRPTKKPIEAEFNFRYYDLNMTAKEMAEIYGVKEHTIHNWATEFRKKQVQ